MQILPDLPFNLPTNFINALLTWASAYVYAVLERRDRGNEWLKLSKLLNFVPIEEACDDYIKRKSQKNVTHTLDRLVRALFVKSYCGYSLRETEQAIRYNLAIKRFVGYGLHEMGCDHTTLERFEVWVAQNQPRIYFDTVLAQIDQKLGERAKGEIQYADTFALKANAAPQSLVMRIRGVCERLVQVSAKANEMSQEAVWERFDAAQLRGKAEEQSWYRLTSEEREKRIAETVKGALACQVAVRGLEKTDVDCNLWHSYLDKVLSDEVAVTKDEMGAIIAVKRLGKKECGSYRLGSAVDPEATFREHGEGKKEFGYNASVATTEAFVRAIRADTGATPDAVPLPTLMEAQKEHHGHVPEKVVYDRAAGAGKTIAEVSKATDGKTQLVAQMRNYGKRSERYSAEEFQFDRETWTLTCPQGAESNAFFRHGEGKGWQVRFYADKHGCGTCPLQANCLEKPTQKTRNVFVSDYRSYWEAAVAYMTTDSFREEMRQRAHVERIIAALVRYNDARRARRRGLGYADYQLKMAGMAYNAKKWLKIMGEMATMGEVCQVAET